MQVLAGDYDHLLAPVSAGTSGIVALLALVMAVLALLARRRKRTRGLGMVAAAFLVFAAKNLFSAVNVLTHAVPHDVIELVLSLFDLVILLILFAPFVRRRRD